MREGLQDVLVEPRRAPLILGFVQVKEAALADGAMGASISGGGPSVFAWFASRAQAEAAAPAMQAAFAAAGFESRLGFRQSTAPAAKVIDAHENPAKDSDRHPSESWTI